MYQGYLQECLYQSIILFLRTDTFVYIFVDVPYVGPYPITQTILSNRDNRDGMPLFIDCMFFCQAYLMGKSESGMAILGYNYINSRNNRIFIGLVIVFRGREIFQSL